MFKLCLILTFRMKQKTTIYFMFVMTDPDLVPQMAHSTPNVLICKTHANISIVEKVITTVEYCNKKEASTDKEKQERFTLCRHHLKQK